MDYKRHLGHLEQESFPQPLVQHLNMRLCAWPAGQWLVIAFEAKHVDLGLALLPSSNKLFESKC